MKKIAFVGIIGVALLTACGVDSGTVESKTIDPEHVTYDDERYCSSRKSNGTCRNYSYREVRRVDDEDFILRICNDEGDCSDVDVERSEYDSVEVGDFYER